VLLGGIPGVAPANVVILGGGVVGHNAAKVASGLGANVIIIDKSLTRLREIDDIYNGAITTLASNAWTIRESLRQADLVIGAVLIPGASAPKLVRREYLGQMRRGSVIVDVAIDQGGCFETSRATTHSDPTYEVDGITHYCVTNMPGAVPITSTYALTNATLPYLVHLASDGVRRAVASDPGLKLGVNIAGGQVTYEPVASAVGAPYVPLSEVLAGVGATG
jgi:alanine dehydrogenase